MLEMCAIQMAGEVDRPVAFVLNSIFSSMENK